MADRLHHIDLCSGIGGFALGFEWAGLSRPVLFCDIEPWSRKILAKHWPDVPITDDVKVIANDQIDLFQELTPEKPSLPQAIPASPSVSLESKKAQKMTAISGRSLAKLLHTKDPLLQFSKMFMATLPWASTKCLLTWKPKITPRGRLLCQLAASTPRTDATDSGLLHTPTAKANQLAPSMNSGWNEPLWATPTKAIAKGSTAGNPNRPNKGGGRDLRQDVKMYPTPTAHIHKEGGFPAEYTRNTPTLTAEATKVDGKPHSSGSLNPQWVEWLMGYPVGYTDLNS